MKITDADIAMSTEFGIFTDEGCIEAGFVTRASADAGLAKYSPDDGAEVHAVCHDHPEQVAYACEFCCAEESEE